MKKFLLIGLLTAGLSSYGFDVHFYKDSGTETTTITNASKIIFSTAQTTVTDNTGADHNIANTTFSHIGFTASSGIDETGDYNKGLVTVDGKTLSISAERVSAIEIFSLSGNLAAKTIGSSTCDISTLARGTYLVRINADGRISVVKIFKQL